MRLNQIPWVKRLRERPEVWILPLVIFACYLPALDLFFVLDDLDLFGPAVGERFLREPLGVFTRLSYLHYSPVTGIWNGILSGLFGSDPAPYHATALLLFSFAAILLATLFRTYGMEGFAPLGGALFFVLNPSGLEVPLWLSSASFYLWLVAFLSLALLAWERFLRTGRRGAALLALAWVLLAQWTHGLGVIVPFFLLVRAALMPARDRAPGLRPLLLWGAGILSAAGVFQLLPRLLLDGIPHRAGMTSWADPLLVVVLGLLGMVTGLLTPPNPWVTVGGILFFSILAVGVFSGRRHWRMALLGLLLAGIAWSAVPVLWGGSAASTTSRFRYMFLPGVGLSLILASALQNLREASGRWGRFPGALLASLLVAALAFSWIQSARYSFPDVLRQNQYVERCARTYRRELVATVRRQRGRPVAILDLYLALGLKGHLIQEKRYSNIHTFYFGHRKDLSARILLVPIGQRMPFETHACFAPQGGKLFSMR